MRRKRVAVMQPYFYPYAGYFRLLALVDEFVIFDCVQFPRRGRVHRTSVGERNGAPTWLTLPLKHQPRNTVIAGLEFVSGARAEFDRRLLALPWVTGGTGIAADRIRSALFAPLESPIDYLETGLRLVADLLGFAPTISRSSCLGLDPTLKGQDRVMAAAIAAGASEYVNSPGGRSLYDGDAFAARGLRLLYLKPYTGACFHLLPAMMTLHPGVVRRDVLDNAMLCT